MKISTKVECGIIAITDIAIFSEQGKTVTVTSIAERRKISEKYLEQILSSLRHFKLIKGMKGFKGGYVLSKKADKITMSDVLNALDALLLNNDIPEVDDDSSELYQTINEVLWNKIEINMKDYASSITVAMLADCYKNRLASSEPMYYI
ncbi:MAG: Rrf2 family transcriptional regulator [Oscillospiraceae bacterium]|nr:Rrf2 family transcriptional regulator [Oscillospiraceae bacterium]